MIVDSRRLPVKDGKREKRWEFPLDFACGRCGDPVVDRVEDRIRGARKRP